LSCENCKHSERRMHILGWRLSCRLYKRLVAKTDRCIDWRRA